MHSILFFYLPHLNLISVKSFLFILFLLISLSLFAQVQQNDPRFISYTADPKKQTIRLYYKDAAGQHYRSLGNLKATLAKQGKQLLFAMNAGMYMEDNTPVGLFIEDHRTTRKLNTRNASGNFYLKPNGVFYITDKNKAAVCETNKFRANSRVKYATQSGPMLLIDGVVHPKFTEGSSNITLRNGVGILPNGNVLFVITAFPVNLYEFAMYFKAYGCKNALYLDGAISQAYIPSKNLLQTGGNFGPLIGVTAK